MVMVAMALATEAMVDTVWDTVLWDILDSAHMVPSDTLVPLDTAVLDTAATTLARERPRLSQRLNPRLMPMPTMVGEAMASATEAMVDTVWDTLASALMVPLDTPLVPLDTAVWDTAVLDTAATTLARERPRLSQRLMLMPTTDMGLDTEAMVDTVWDTAPTDILVTLDILVDMEAMDTDVDTATWVEREVICYERS